MCIFFCTFARCIVMGCYAVDADFIINDNYCQLKLSINVNSRIDFVFAQKNAARAALVIKTKKMIYINDNDCQLKLSINVNSKIDFVFAQKNAAHCIGEQNKKDDMYKRQWLS